MRDMFSNILVSFALCLSIIVMPAAADADSFAQAYEDTLTVYGNANSDDIIDEDDVEYVQGIIDGTEDETQFADANYDGKIDEDDIAQIELIIAGEEDELTILDMENRTVTVPMPVERIVSAAGFDATRTLIQLGVQDKIVGCSYPTSWSTIWYAAPELEALPDPGGASGKSFNVEEAVSLEPDVIFVWVSANADKIQEKSHVPTIAVSPGGDLWVVDMLRIIGAVTGTDENARELAAYTKEKVDEIAKITSEVPDEKKPVVYCCGCYGSLKGLPITCRCCGTCSDIEFAGGLNVVEATGGQVSKEQVIKWNPDVIIIQWGTPETINEVLSDPVLQKLNAVKNERVYSTRIGYCSGGVLGQHLIQVHYLAKLFYPDEFEDLDMEEEGNEIMEHLYGADGMYTDMAGEYNFYRWD
jgi:iron complex transport system substrate-binding protein